MGQVKKIQECKKIKVRRQLFVKPIAIVKPYVPENIYKTPQIYVPQVVETRPLEESDEETYEDQLEIFDDIPEIDDEQVRILDRIVRRIDVHLENEFGTPRRSNGRNDRRELCFGCCLCDEQSEHNHCCITTVCPYIQDLFERCRGCCCCIEIICLYVKIVYM
ncbi:uncharacterized protein LOC136093941 [Hydra vulgaris]|uniref:uncharacterized protein LOC136093941 n=1 Tax=Hydra vulgaris TaxID=6087 RepID=UPI0032EA5FA0